MKSLSNSYQIEDTSGEEPLAEFPFVATSSVEEAESALSHSLASCQIRSDPSRFGVRLNGINLGRVSLTFNSYNSEARVESEFSDAPVFFVVGNRIPTTFRLSGQTVGVELGNPLMLAHNRRMEICRPENSGILVLRATMPDLEHQLATLTDHRHRGGLTFDLDSELSEGAGGSLMRLMQFLVSELKARPSIAKNVAFRRGYEEAFLNALLSLPHNRQDLLLEERSDTAPPRLVSRAQEYMRAKLGEPVTISDLLRLCGCSRGTLFSAFRNAKGYSPMEFLTEQRLHAARKKLLNLTGPASVSSIAVDCGFVHLGRFANAYRKRFGESPSETLKRAGGRL